MVAASAIALASSAPSHSKPVATNADCSRATALVVGRPFFRDEGMPNPIGQVLCGPFAGAGSEAMGRHVQRADLLVSPEVDDLQVR